MKQTSIHGYHILVFLNEEVGCKIHCYRSFEKWESRLLGQLIEDDAICLDIGANIGYYSLLMASRARKGQVHAFEPVAKNFHLICVSALLNGFENLVPNCAAVGNATGSRSFSISEDSAYSSFRHTGRSRASGTLNVPVTTLDAYCQERELPRIDVLKVDVEGAEKLVLEGASACLTDPRRRPAIMMLELYEPMLQEYGTSIDEIVMHLRDFEYCPFVCLRGRVAPFERRHHNRFWNVFFVRDRAVLERRAVR